MKQAILTKYLGPTNTKGARGKALVLAEHTEAMGVDLGAQVPTIRQLPRDKSRFWVYWEDGEIQRRDTYWVSHGEAVLESMEQRYHAGRWVHVY